MKAPLAIIIDLDGVIRHFPKGRDQEIERRFGLPSTAIASAAFSPDLLHPAITGRCTDSEWRHAILSRLKQTFPDLDVNQAIQEWSIFPGIADQEVIQMLRAQWADCPLMLMTNATDRLAKDLSTLGLGTAFDRIFNSSEMGMAKPDPGAFHFVLESLGYGAEQLVFVDDSASNVAAAQSLGMIGIQFKGLASFRTDL